MGNAVLMPEFYGIGIKRSPHTSLIFDNKQEPVEVRKLNYRTTYDSEAGSSFFSDLKQSEVVEVQPQDSKAQLNEMKNTQSSFTLNPQGARSHTNPEDLSMEIYSTKKYKKKEQEGDQLEKDNDRSLINILTGIEDTESERQAIRQKCSVLYEMGKYAWKNGWISETINYFQDVLKESPTSFPQNNEEKAVMLSMLGNCYFRLQKYQQSQQKYSAALHVLELNLPQNRSKCADIHMVLGTISQKLSQFQKAIYHFNEAYQLKKAAHPKSSVDLLAPLSYIALNEIYRGNHYKAVQKYCQTLKINREVYGSSHIEVARNFFNLGLSLFAVGEYSSWLQYHYQSLRMMKELNLQGHPEYAVWLKWFKNKLRELMRLQSYAQEVVGRSIMMMSVFLSEDEQIEFLSGVKEDIEGSLVRQDTQ